MSERHDDSRERSYAREDAIALVIAAALAALVLFVTLVVPGWYYG